MEVTGKDILNLTCAVKVVETACRNGYYVFTQGVKKDMNSALQEAINKYREQLKETKGE
jgi:hypothetical protein